jgi:hypothetical protein
MRAFYCRHCNTVFQSKKLVQFCSAACRFAHKEQSTPSTSVLVGDTTHGNTSN